MGCGKSNIGRRIYNELPIEWLDLDDQICEAEGQKIPKIFETKGEHYFRKRERDILRDTLRNNDKPLILSVGGGVPCFYDNMDMLLKHSHVIYLQASAIWLSNRVFGKSKRPLVRKYKTIDDLITFVTKHLKEREIHYKRADRIVNVEVQGRWLAAMQIIDMIKNEEIISGLDL